MAKISLRVNGEVREVEPAPGRTLMKWLRDDLGLTGTKCGCNVGDCGSCKVLVDGKSVTSCNLPLKKLEGAEVLTIEGLSPDAAVSPDKPLHPVQHAFIDAGAIQCGFCTPGMVITTVALLQEDPRPGEERIREAFRGNLCRCTGYRAIIDAVRLASERISGSAPAPVNESTSSPDAKPGSASELDPDPKELKTELDLEPKMELDPEPKVVLKPEPRMEGEKAVGAAQPVWEARRKVTGRLRYTADLTFPGMLYGKILYAPAAHGRITSIDTAEAEALPGVRALVTFDDQPDRSFNSHITVPFQEVPKNEMIFNRHFRFHDDRIAAVAADDEATAAKALRLIKFEWEEYPPLLTIDQALSDGAPEIHPGGNLADTLKQEAFDNTLKSLDVPENKPEDGRNRISEESFSGRFHLSRVSHAALERHITVADWDGESLTLHSSCQNVFCYQAMLAELFDLPFHRVRVIKPPVGGAFGGKSEMVTEPVAALLALRTGRPVQLELSRKEVFRASRTRTGGDIEVTITLDKSGAFARHHYHVRLDRGAYFGSGYDLGYALMDKAFRLYRVFHIKVKTELVYTNKQVAGALRGYGNPQITFAREVLIDRICRAKGFDPVEFRLSGLHDPGDSNPLNGESLGNMRIKEVLSVAARRISWEEKKREAELSCRAGGRYRKGIGLAVGVHGSGIHPDCTDYSTAAVRMNSDGTVLVNISAHENGQGSNVVMAKIAADVLAIPVDRIALVETDTMVTHYDNGSYASRETWVCGGAVKKAAERVLEQLEGAAAELLECTREELRRSGESFYATIPGAGKEVAPHLTLKELCSQVQNRYPYRDIQAVESYASPFDPGSCVAVIAEVVADMEEKRIRVERITALHDSGTIINPLMARGQVEGGIQMGLGYALCEDIEIDPESGKQLTAAFRSYKQFGPGDMPEMEILFLNSSEEAGPYGAKGLGEAATVAIAPAVINAISCATGLEIFSLPFRWESTVEGKP